jgi:hypothetical protein
MASKFRLCVTGNGSHSFDSRFFFVFFRVFSCNLYFIIVGLKLETFVYHSFARGYARYEEEIAPLFSDLESDLAAGDHRILGSRLAAGADDPHESV